MEVSVIKSHNVYLDLMSFISIYRAIGWQYVVHKWSLCVGNVIHVYLDLMAFINTCTGMGWPYVIHKTKGKKIMFQIKLHILVKIMSNTMVTIVDDKKGHNCEWHPEWQKGSQYCERQAAFLISQMAYLLGCGVGKYMNGRECADCRVGTFQDKPFHTDTVCTNCSGKLTIFCSEI